MSLVQAGHEQNYKSWFSRAFLVAAAASAGLTCVPSGDQDFDSVDFTIRRGVFGIDIQLKSTDGEDLFVDLDQRSYDLLTDERRGFPAYLVLVRVGQSRANWISHQPGLTTLLHEARWARLTGLPSTANTQTTRVRVPEENLLTTYSLTGLVDAAEAEARS